MQTTDSTRPGPLGVLRRFAQSRPQPTERCDLCGTPLGPEHDHLLSLQTRQLSCSCLACALLFSDERATRYRRVPRRCEVLGDFQMDDALWDSLLIPINLAFFYHNTTAGHEVAVYPSPAGPTESRLELDSWQELATANPILNDFAPDVEALLVNRMGDVREYYRVSIDRCYELVGLIRLYWRGLSGGQDVWLHMQRFFERLKQTATGGVRHA